MNFCSNCSKEFPEERLHLHEAYCVRNIRKCPHCPQFIDNSVIQTHIQQTHSEQPCPQCNTPVKPVDLTAHALICPQRPTYCQYCQLNVPFSGFIQHQNMCSSKTKQCFKCFAYVTLKNYPSHVCQQSHPQPHSQPLIPPPPSFNPPPIQAPQISIPSIRPIYQQVPQPFRNRSALHARGNQQQVRPKQKTDQGYLTAEQTAPCLIRKPETYTSIIRARGPPRTIDIIPISLRYDNQPLRDKN